MIYFNTIDKMLDFLLEDKESFINKYSYISGLEYDITHDKFYSDVVNNTVKIYEEIYKNTTNKIDSIMLKDVYIQELDKFVSKLTKFRQEKIKQILDNKNIR